MAPFLPIFIVRRVLARVSAPEVRLRLREVALLPVHDGKIVKDTGHVGMILAELRLPDHQRAPEVCVRLRVLALI